MTKPKPSKYDLEERTVRAEEWKKFRRSHMFTQTRLAEITGVSRRTIQQVEAGRINPHPDTLARVIRLVNKHEKKGRKKYAAVAEA